MSRGPETKKFENIRRKALEKVMAVLCSLQYQSKESVLAAVGNGEPLKVWGLGI